MTFAAPVPALRSFDAARTKAFYIGVLGFEMVSEHRLEPGMPLYMGIRRDVVAFAADLSARHHGNARPDVPGHTPWGTREITIVDPSSGRLAFFTPDAPAS